MPRTSHEPGPLPEPKARPLPREDVIALIEALARGEGLAGYALAPGAGRLRGQTAEHDVRIATHPARPALRLCPCGTVVHEGRGEVCAPTPALALGRLRATGAVAEMGYTLIVAEEMSEPLSRALGAEPAATSPGVFVADGVIVERVHARTFVTCSDPAAVSRCLAFAHASGARVRFEDERANVAGDAERPGLDEVLAACGGAQDGLCVGAAGRGRFVQERVARGEVAEALVVEPGRVVRAPLHGRSVTVRVARWMARGRLAFLRALRNATQDGEPTRAAMAAGWTFWPELVCDLAGLVALGEWGGVVNDRLGPQVPGPAGRGVFRASARGPLLPLGVFPFGGGELFADAGGVLVGPPWDDASAVVPMASGARTLLEKFALEDELRATPVGRAPWVRVSGTAGRDFWRRLPAQREAAASDEISEHWVGDGVWVERGLDAEEQPFVRLCVVPEDTLIVLAKRLARASGNALVVVDCAGAEGWTRLEQLRAAGLRAAPAD